MANVTVTKVEPLGKKKEYFIARHEGLRVQFTGETKSEACKKLENFLKNAAEEVSAE